MQKTDFPLSRGADLVVQDHNGEVLIYDLRKNKAFCLNETSSLVWQLCDGERSVPEITRLVSEKLNSSASEDLIWLALDQLKKEDLLANGDQISLNFAGMSRREVIRKVGMGTVVALPIVASLVAPTAVSAQSCLPEGVSCEPTPDPTQQCCPGLTCAAGICETVDIEVV